MVVSPDMFLNVACPTYPEIRLAVLPGRQVGRLLGSWQPSAIHIATEGPLGQAARRYCIRRRLPFSTAYHTRFPEYIQVRTGLPTGLTYGFMRRFHAPARSVMVATSSLQSELEKRGFKNIRRWSRGVDTEQFRPGDKSFLRLPRPIHLFVGRIAIEKSIEDFLRLDLAGTKLVVGDGPLLEDFRRRYPDVVFTGAKHGNELAAYYAASDIFVFPSRTDTFGLVLLEALASGLPVAAFPVAGPLDIIDGTGAGVLNDDLSQAILAAAAIPSSRCREVALTYNWRRSAEQFLGNLIPFE
jgi:glycosyltransferase involved in cell wall biosynthesis